MYQFLCFNVRKFYVCASVGILLNSRLKYLEHRANKVLKNDTKLCEKERKK